MSPSRQVSTDWRQQNLGVDGRLPGTIRQNTYSTYFPCGPSSKHNRQKLQRRSLLRLADVHVTVRWIMRPDLAVLSTLGSCIPECVPFSLIDHQFTISVTVALCVSPSEDPLIVIG